MYEKLVAELRAGYTEPFVLNGAADAIEELSREYESIAASLTESVELVRKLQSPRWIPVTERLPEESESLNYHEEMTIRVTSVWCCDAKTGTIEVRNRFQHKITGIQFLDQNIQDTDWHWSKSWWEPTHWMPIVPLPEPPKEETE